MSISKKIIFLEILVSLVFLTTLPSNGYCDDWVKTGGCKDFTLYYKSSPVKIDKENKIIKVWTKSVFTEKGKIDFKKIWVDILKKQALNDINYQLDLNLLDYKEWKFKITQTIYYSKSGDRLLAYEYQPNEYQPEWINIIPDSVSDSLLIKILKDNNISR